MSETSTKELSTAILMVAYLCTHVYPIPFDRQVEVLDRFELSDEDIAKVLGCTIKAVKTIRVQNDNSRDRRRKT
jgi:hypothetical protein